MPKEYTSLWTLLMTPRCGQCVFFLRKKFLRGYHAISWKFHDVVWASGYTMNASLVCSIQFFSGWFESWWWVFLIKIGPEMNSSFLTWFPFERKSCSTATAVECWTTIQHIVFRVGSNPADGLFFNLVVPKMNSSVHTHSPCIVRNWLLGTTVMCRTNFQ